MENQSHKIVAKVWGLKPEEVHDRFVAEKHAFKRRVVAWAAIAVLFVGSVVGGLFWQQWQEAVRSSAAEMIAGIGQDGFLPESLPSSYERTWTRFLAWAAAASFDPSEFFLFLPPWRPIGSWARGGTPHTAIFGRWH